MTTAQEYYKKYTIRLHILNRYNLPTIITLYIILNNDIIATNVPNN